MSVKITGPVAIDTGDFGKFALIIGETGYKFPAHYKSICPWTHEADVEDYLRFLIDKARAEGIQIKEVPSSEVSALSVVVPASRKPNQRSPQADH